MSAVALLIQAGDVLSRMGTTILGGTDTLLRVCELRLLMLMGIAIGLVCSLYVVTTSHR